MSTYMVGITPTLQGDDVLFGGKNIFQKIGSAVKSVVTAPIKFVLNPVKESKAALKTIARFDPTAKTAKYGNITKGALMIGAAAVAAPFVGPAALALAKAGAQTGLTPVRKPVPYTSPQILPGVDSMSAPSSNVLIDSTGYTSQPIVNQPAPPMMAAFPDKTNLLAIGCVVAAVGAFIYFSKQKPL
jgi:hypothetical protein